jgi:SNF2 family DNA or RNA helicase
MGKVQADYYKQMRDDMMAILQSGEVITAPIVLTQLLRLRQASCNIYPSGTEQEYRFIEEKDERIEEVLNVLEESAGKAIIWATFTPSVERIAKIIGEKFGATKVGFIHGIVSKEERKTIIDAFKTGEIDYLVMNPKTGGSGLDLWQASTVIYYNNDWSLDVRMQSEDRAHRIGQTKSVLYVDIVCKETLDEKIIAALKSKNSLALQITGDNLRNILEG